MDFEPKFMATHLAAMPNRDPIPTSSFILETFPEPPSIPRLTKSTRMYLEQIPCLVVDREKKKLWFDISPEREHEILDFYEKFANDNLERLLGFCQEELA